MKTCASGPYRLCVRQVDHAKSLHYVGAGVAFPAGLLFVCLQCVLTYRVAVTALDYWMAHFRVALALGAMVSLVLSILFIPSRFSSKKLKHCFGFFTF